VIQGYFPHGLPRFGVPAAGSVQPKTAGTAAWVQQAISRHVPAALVQAKRSEAPRVMPVQRLANPSAVPLPPNVAKFPTGAGQPLPPAVRQKMEAFFGANFSDVRVHTGMHASSIGALAFTQGSDIHFAVGHYSPSTPQGQRILAHELAHVVQQRSARVRNPFATGVAIVRDAALEAEAEQASRKYATFQAPVAQRLRGPLVQPRMAAGTIQRVVPAQAQTNTNLCWAAVGYAIHRHKGGAAATLLNFVTAQGTANALANFNNNTATDIDEIIGSLSTTNRLTGSDSEGSYGKAAMTVKLNAGDPIVANVNNNHYIILTASSMATGRYQLTYMEPATGAFVTEDAAVDPLSMNKVIGVGAYRFSVLYYTG
jgi:hypothetical protein